MSASSRLARQVATRHISVTSTLPQLIRHQQPRGLLAARSLPRTTLRPNTAIQVLLNKAYSTETSTPSGGLPSGPPPGFNVEEARKPLRREQKKSEASGSKTVTEPRPTSKDGVTAVEKTPGSDSSKLATKDVSDEKKTEVKKEEKKLSIGQRVKKELEHYRDGTKLLATEVKISTKLAVKMAAGYELSRRENRQLTRTVADLSRLVPFLAFVIVPFAELLLPVALKMFPNLLPSTYEGQKSKDAKAANLRATRKEVSSLLRNTLKETGLPLSTVQTHKQEFTEFFRKVRATGEKPTSDDVIKVCKIFKDDLTLDNLSRPQLVGMCRYMNLSTFGTDMMLRYQIRHRMRQIKRDDKAISFEGVESLSVTELQMACASRGLRTQGLSPGRLRDDLSMWLDLRLKYGVPSTLLVLSNAFVYAQGKECEISNQIDALEAVLSSIPEELFHEIELEVHNAEGAATNRQRLEVLKEQQELIEEENEQSDSGSGSPQRPPKDNEDIDEKEEIRRADAEKEGQDPNQSVEALEAERDGAEAMKAEQGKKE